MFTAKLHWMALALGMAGIAACAAEMEQSRSPLPDQPPAETRKQESSRPPVQPVPAESRTPEEAARRAADPKDPSGALIISPAAADNLKKEH